MAIHLPWLDPDSLSFPDPETALSSPNGLLAAGGDLATARLLKAYSMGIFPWYSEGEPILWWSPDPRTVIFPGQTHASRSLKKSLRRQPFCFTTNQAFTEVVRACQQPRGQPVSGSPPGTWITEEMVQAYVALHEQGHAHSIECWLDERLVGGLYGVVLNGCFFGESMFSRVPDASKAVMLELDRHYLQEQQYKLLDCQVASAHLFSMGAVEIPRAQFIQLIA